SERPGQDRNRSALVWHRAPQRHLLFPGCAGGRPAATAVVQRSARVWYRQPDVRALFADRDRQERRVADADQRSHGRDHHRTRAALVLRWVCERLARSRRRSDAQGVRTGAQGLTDQRSEEHTSELQSLAYLV